MKATKATMRDLFNEYADRVAASDVPGAGEVADELRAWGAWRGSVELADRWAFDATMVVLSFDEAEDDAATSRRRAALRVAVQVVDCIPRRVGDEVSAVVDDYWRRLARSFCASGGDSQTTRAQTVASRRTAWREFCEMTGTRPARVGERLGPWRRVRPPRLRREDAARAAARLGAVAGVLRRPARVGCGPEPRGAVRTEPRVGRRRSGVARLRSARERDLTDR